MATVVNMNCTLLVRILTLLAYDLMMHLLDGYFHAGHNLYCDNFYTSPTLFLHLYNRRMSATGTMHLRKGCPKALYKAKLKNKVEK